MTEKYYRISVKKDGYGNQVWRIEETIEIHNVRVRFLGNGVFLYEYNWVRGEFVDPSLNAIREFNRWLKLQNKRKNGSK